MTFLGTLSTLGLRNALRSLSGSGRCVRSAAHRQRATCCAPRRRSLAAVVFIAGQPWWASKLDFLRHERICRRRLRRRDGRLGSLRTRGSRPHRPSARGLGAGDQWNLLRGQDRPASGACVRRGVCALGGLCASCVPIVVVVTILGPLDGRPAYPRRRSRLAKLRIAHLGPIRCSPTTPQPFCGWPRRNC